MFNFCEFTYEAYEAGASGSIHARWANIVFFYPIVQKKKVTLGPLFRSKNDENRACVTKKCFR